MFCMPIHEYEHNVCARPYPRYLQYCFESVMCYDNDCGFIQIVFSSSTYARFGFWNVYVVYACIKLMGMKTMWNIYISIYYNTISHSKLFVIWSFRVFYDKIGLYCYDYFVCMQSKCGGGGGGIIICIGENWNLYRIDWRTQRSFFFYVFEIASVVEILNIFAICMHECGILVNIWSFACLLARALCCQITVVMRTV